jgi:hypothetical protein
VVGFVACECEGIKQGKKTWVCMCVCVCFFFYIYIRVSLLLLLSPFFQMLCVSAIISIREVVILISVPANQRAGWLTFFRDSFSAFFFLGLVPLLSSSCIAHRPSHISSSPSFRIPAFLF